MHNNLNLQKIAYTIIIVIGLGWLSVIGKSILLPLIFAILFSIFLYPIDKKILSFVKIKWVSIPLTFLVVLIPILIVAMLFSYQIVNIMESLPSIESSLKDGFEQSIQKINGLLPFADVSPKTVLPSNDSSIPNGSLGVVSKGIMTSASFIVSSGLCFMYTFFLLFYRKSFKNFIIYQFEKENRPDIKDTLKEIKETIQSYIGGVGLVMVILSILNTIGLTVIGIEHAMFWGVLAGVLSIIPYAGTALGGMLPFVFALSTAESSWQPIAVLVYYMVIQQVEGNFITPNIVGNKVDINPFFAILSIVILGTLWGVGGVLLALPLISITRIILGQFQSTEPIAFLMSSSIMDKGKFKKWAANVE